MNWLHSDLVAVGANAIGIAFAAIAIFGLHHHLWKRIGASRRRPHDAAAEAAVWRAVRGRPVVPFRAPRTFAPETVH